MPDGTAVLAPLKDYEYEPAHISDALAVGRTIPTGNRPVIFVKSRQPFAMPEDELIAADGYYGRLLDGGCVVPHSSEPVRVWIWSVSTPKEGLFSLVFWALGFLEHTAALEPSARLLIDWTDARICFHGGRAGGCTNVWNHFFEQPPHSGGSVEMLPTAAVLSDVMEAGRCMLITRFGPGWFEKLGKFRGADQGEGGKKGGGRLDKHSVEQGRAAVRRWLVVRPKLLQRAGRHCLHRFSHYTTTTKLHYTTTLLTTHNLPIESFCLARFSSSFVTSTWPPTPLHTPEILALAFRGGAARPAR